MFPWSGTLTKWFSGATASAATASVAAPKAPPSPRSIRLSCIPEGVSPKELQNWLEGLALPSLSDASTALVKDIEQENVISLSMARVGGEFQAIATLKVIPACLTKMTRAMNVPGPHGAQLVVDDDFFGMTVVYAPEDTESIEADIIAVPGFGGHAFGSWKSLDPRCTWLRDFLPHDYPNIRVIVYGYDTNVKGKSDWKANMSDLAKNMIDSLDGIRDQESFRRPILFLGHSLGGIIVKEAIVASSAWQKSDERYQDVFQSCSSVIFFGVPHVGMRFQELEGMMQGRRGLALAKKLQIDDDNEGPEILERLNSSFGQFVVGKESFNVVCYYERDRTVIGHEKEDRRILLVTKESATYPGKTLVPLEAIELAGDHRTMIKFNTKNDEGYKSVARNIGRIIKIGKQVRSDANPPHTFIYGVTLPGVPNFLGRDGELARIAEASKSLHPKSSQTVVIRAMGGQGKTQLALAYCQSRRDEADVFWVDSSSERSLKKDMAAAARLIDGSISIPDADGLMNYTHQKLTNASRLWVLVFDNYDDPESFSILGHMPQSTYGLIIITTRHKDNDSLADKKFRIELGGLSGKDALKVLSNESEIPISTREGDLESDPGMKVVAKLGYHALAISQAGGIIKRRYKTFSAFLECFEKEKQKILDDKRLNTKHYFKRDRLKDQDILLSVFTTLELSYQQLEAVDKENYASDVLTLLAFFDSREVSEILFKECCSAYTPAITKELESYAKSPIVQDKNYQEQPTSNSQLPGDNHKNQVVPSRYTPGIFLTLHAGEWNSSDYTELLDLLVSLSLVQPDNQTDYDAFTHFSLHPLIRDWIRLRTEPLARQGYSSLAATCIYLLLCATPWTENRYVMPLPRKLEIAAHLDVCEENQRMYFEDSGHLPILGMGKADIGRPELLFGRLTDDNGQDERSERWFRQSLKLREEKLGVDHPDTLMSKNDVAQALSWQSKYAAAEKMHKETLESRQKVLVPNHRDTLTSMNNLAEATSGRDHALAEEIYRQTLQLRKEKFGSEDLDTLTSMSGLALELTAQDKYFDAETMYRDLLELRKMISGPQHPDTLVDMSNFASALSSQGKYIEAEAKHRQILAIRKEVVGLRHPDTLMSMNKLASVLNGQGKYIEAQKLHEETLELRREILGPEHKDTLTSMQKLAAVLSSQGKTEEAKEMRQQTLESMYSHACQLHKQGLYEDSIPMYSKAYRGFRNRYGEEGAKTVECREQMESAKRKRKAPG